MQTQRVLDEFKNEPFTDYSLPENAAAMQAALDKVRGELGRKYPCVIGGDKVQLPTKFESLNPASRTEVVGVFSEVDSDTSLARERSRLLRRRSRPGSTFHRRTGRITCSVRPITLAEET